MDLEEADERILADVLEEEEEQTRAVSSSATSSPEVTQIEAGDQAEEEPEPAASTLNVYLMSSLLCMQSASAKAVFMPIPVVAILICAISWLAKRTLT